MSDQLQDFEQFMKRREDVAKAYVNGDSEPISNIATVESPATFFGPGGGTISGPEAVTSAYIQGASAFETEGESELEILHTAASHNIAYWVGLQRAKVQLKSNPKPVPMDLRITEIFRRDGDDWKLIHRHADTLVEDQKKN
ncbi:DUF4440 domain-containing protein, partial [bacterium]